MEFLSVIVIIVRFRSKEDGVNRGIGKNENKWVN